MKEKKPRPEDDRSNVAYYKKRLAYNRNKNEKEKLSDQLIARVEPKLAKKSPELKLEPEQKLVLEPPSTASSTNTSRRSPNFTSTLSENQRSFPDS
jgi:hypothetical protein